MDQNSSLKIWFEGVNVLPLFLISSKVNVVVSGAMKPHISSAVVRFDLLAANFTLVQVSRDHVKVVPNL